MEELSLKVDASPGCVMLYFLREVASIRGRQARLTRDELHDLLIAIIKPQSPYALRSLASLNR